MKSHALGILQQKFLTSYIYNNSKSAIHMESYIPTYLTVLSQ